MSLLHTNIKTGYIRISLAHLHFCTWLPASSVRPAVLFRYLTLIYIQYIGCKLVCLMLLSYAENYVTVQVTVELWACQKPNADHVFTKGAELPNKDWWWTTCTFGGFGMRNKKQLIKNKNVMRATHKLRAKVPFTSVTVSSGPSLGPHPCHSSHLSCS